MIHRTLVLTAIACSFLVAASFGIFARDELAGASKHQQQQLVAGQTTSPGVAPIGQQHGQPRRFIDGAAKALTSPFTSIVQSSNQWVVRGVPTIFAVLLYGVGLGYLARFSRGLS